MTKPGMSKAMETGTVQSLQAPLGPTDFPIARTPSYQGTVSQIMAFLTF